MKKLGKNKIISGGSDKTLKVWNVYQKFMYFKY
jgi:hypothetical protein